MVESYRFCNTFATNMENAYHGNPWKQFDEVIDMALVKCPRCELNYMQDSDKYCKVCIRELRGLDDTHDHLELCVVCGERPAKSGSELCVECLREHKSLAADSDDPYVNDYEDPAEEVLHEVDGLDDLELDLGNDDAPASEMSEIEREFGSDDDEDEDK